MRGRLAATMLQAMPAMNPHDVDCGTCPASRRCWPEPATPGGAFLVRRMKPLPAGAVLFNQGSSFEAPFIVTRGCVAVTELLADGAERIVAFRVPGEMVGLESWNRPTHRYGAQAVVATTLCRLRWSAQGGTLRGAALLRALLIRATAQSGEIAMPWAGLSAVERVRAFIGDFRGRTDQPLPMTRAQIGQYLGLAEETVVRAMKTLGRDGRV